MASALALAGVQLRGGPRQWEGKLVRVHGMQGKQVRVSPLQPDGDLRPVYREIEHLEGQCCDWIADTSEYVVVFFEGFEATVPVENLREFSPVSVEEGGVDVAWPSDKSESQDQFPVKLAEALATCGFCVVQMSLPFSVRHEAAMEADELPDFDGVKAEMVVDYMGGGESRTKLKRVADDDPEVVPHTSLGACDRHLTDLGIFVDDFAQDVFGSDLMGRTNAFARLPFSSELEQAQLAPQPILSEPAEAAQVQEFLRFVQSRKLCLLLVLESDGGFLTLHPRPGGGDDIRLPLVENRLLVFRHDQMGYTYEPEGKSAALQAWVLGAMPDVELQDIRGKQQTLAKLLQLTGPWQPEGAQGLVMSLMVRMPGRSWGYNNYWNMFIAGTDCVLEWDGTRWDTDLYYEADRDLAMMTGKSYMHHGGFLDHLEFTRFDNDFFELGEEEAQCMYPGQRIVMETGYESLHRAGYTRGSMGGENIGVHLGDVGPDWHSIDDAWPYMVEGDFNLKRSGVSAFVTCTRLSYFLNLIGPTTSVATACSSSLVALNIAHHAMVNAREDSERQKAGSPLYERALVVGINTLMGPASFMGQCTTGGTTYKGRSFTFDTGADGYQRGEGCSGTFVQMNSKAPMNVEMLACVIGSAVNQDGRSASLTAPNGPSQAALLKAAMKMGGLQPSEVTAAECHGTGTALGDPIEIGALQNALSKRDRAILKTSAKSNMAHLEASAGMAGFAKCIMMILSSATPPNQHLKTLNPHLTVEGYPVYFTTEITPWGQNSGYCGVSSFGIGGTNARGEVMGRCLRGSEVTINGEDLKIRAIQEMDHIVVPCPICLGPMNWLDGAAVPKPALPGRHLPPIRQESADYTICSDCYLDAGGEFRYGVPPKGLRWVQGDIYIRGTWDSYSTTLKMEETKTGVYECQVMLGETRCERFQLFFEQARNLAIYPARDNAHQRTRIQGPDSDPAGNHWLIDGRDDQISAGTIYQIIFEWRNERKRISWTPLDTKETTTTPLEEIAGWNFLHRYFIAGSWNSFSLSEMVRDTGVAGSWQTSFKLGPYGKEEFQIVRDRDMTQTVHPAECSLMGMTPASVPVRGPDEFGAGKTFVVHGKESERATVKLQVSDGSMTVSYSSPSCVSWTWRSEVGWSRRSFHVTGSFNNWSFEEMSAVEGEPGVFSYYLTLIDGEVEFRVAVDRDPTQVMYPQAQAAGSGEGFLEGPTALSVEDAEKAWLLRGWPGSTFDVRLNMLAVDRRRMITWLQVS